MKSACIWSFSGLYYPAFGLNTHQKNYEYKHFSRSINKDEIIIKDNSFNGTMKHRNMCSVKTYNSSYLKRYVYQYNQL